MNSAISLLKSRPAVLGLGFALGVAGLGLGHATEKALSSNPPATLKLADRQRRAEQEQLRSPRKRSLAIRRQRFFLESRPQPPRIRGRNAYGSIVPSVLWTGRRRWVAGLPKTPARKLSAQA